MTQHCEARMSPLSQANVFMEIFGRNCICYFFGEYFIL